MAFWRRASEGLARKTSRRGFFGRGADVAFGALVGVAAGAVTNGSRASAVFPPTKCGFPGSGPCECDKCLSNGTCAKPCLILTTYYASGCWVTGANNSITCCDCNCQGLNGIQDCGCGSDYHNDPAYCP